MAFNLMIDTNIFIDILTKREPFFEHSKMVLSLCEENKIHGFFTASTITDLFYLLHHEFHDTKKVYEALSDIMNIAKVLTVTSSDVLNAFSVHAHDFEDCLLATCAISNHCDAIVTRNPSDFKNFGIPVYSPEELLTLLQ